ncbi:glycosyltransferase family 2 protein [Pedobacter sp. MW01-1-1]|uniref:glycosyltransferase family 2 protein n=1 Tax=Pedobacter sp. MW01-1-1 TaxID=3383027 RepID=UPI003FED6DB2
MASISIITVNFNQHQVNLDFLASIKRVQTKHFIEVIFVDNGSKVEYEETYRACYPTINYIRSEKNLGFAGGNNIGIKAAKGEYLLFLNNDTEITENLFDTLVEEMENNPAIGIISPLICYFDQPDIIQYAGFTPMNYLTARNEGIGSFEKNIGQFNTDSRETAYCHGAAMMCRKSDLQTVGLMPEQYFLYYEELDWCEKFKRAGKKVWFSGKTLVYHKESISVGKESSIKTYFFARNRLLFIRRNTSLINTCLFTLYFILVVCTRDSLKYSRKGRKDLIKWIYKGLFWNFTHSTTSKNLGYNV